MSTPYFTDGTVTLYHGDCLEVLDWLEADVLIMDPPYGIDGHLSAGWKGRKPPAGFVRTHEKPQWDRTLETRDAVLERWGPARPYAVFGSPARLDGALPCREFPLVWDKGTVGMGDVNFPWGRGYELVYVGGEGWSGKRESPIIRVMHSSAAAKVGHPTPKPVELMEHIIRKAPGEVIADPFAGSGSTLVAAARLGRKAIGVELEEKYCEIAARRLSQGVLDFGELA